MRLEIPFAHYWRVTLSDGTTSKTFACYARDRDDAIKVARRKWKNPNAVVQEAVRLADA